MEKKENMRPGERIREMQKRESRELERCRRKCVLVFPGGFTAEVLHDEVSLVGWDIDEKREKTVRRNRKERK